MIRLNKSISIFDNIIEKQALSPAINLQPDLSYDYFSDTQICDIDGDGKLDLITTGNNIQQVIIYKNVSDTTETAANIVNTQSAISVYPNPSVSYSNLEYKLTAQSDVAIKVFDKNGRTVRAYNLKKQAKGVNRMVVQTGDLEKGIYIVNLSANGKNETVKLLKE
ncbi:MAG: T9SS type A sorting domain-containing protein [Chitinophagaceae bacterium]|nr:MAG: T9SS type A sorting domain-containing protein [Chitinophagaceae bacterium]